MSCASTRMNLMAEHLTGAKKKMHLMSMSVAFVWFVEI